VNKLSLVAMAREQLEAARRAPNGRSARTVSGGHDHRLRQTLIALVAGQALGDHRNPGEATVQLLHGGVRLHSGDTNWEGRSGDLLVVPPAVHNLEALDDAVVLLTVVMPGPAPG
jgi:quercetin dioxygenase-like cupin family protein